MLKEIITTALIAMTPVTASAVEVDFLRAPYPNFYFNQTPSGEVFEIGNGSGWTQGGYIQNYFKKMDKHFQAGDEIRITAGVCQSACTFFMLSNFVCVSRKTTFKFHGVTKHGFFKPKNADVYNEYVAQVYDNIGNGKLGNWFRTIVDETGPAKYKKVSGSNMIDKFGVKECK